jgi:hydroxymethylglutaryl-CoA synthase
MAAIQSYGVAFPALRLPARVYREAWGVCSARGLRRKPFCAFDEDAVTLGIAAARRAISGAAVSANDIGALFVGTTTWPYEEKPAAASLVTALLGVGQVRTVEIRGSRQAGLQALVAAVEYVALHSGKVALAVAADAPCADADAPYEHALGAGAAAFVVGSGNGLATIEEEAAVTLETFGSRFRRHGEVHIRDLELRVDDDRKCLDAIARHFQPGVLSRVATGAGADLANRATKYFGGASDGLWPELGDTGAAGAAIALAHCLDEAAPGDRILALAIGGGATALTIATTGVCPRNAQVITQLSSGREVDYLSYLKHKRVLSRQRSNSA